MGKLQKSRRVPLRFASRNATGKAKAGDRDGSGGGHRVRLAQGEDCRTERGLRQNPLSLLVAVMRSLSVSGDVANGCSCDNPAWQDILLR